MTKVIPKQLLTVKDIFLHGEQHAFFDSRLDRRLAIISFHNSIELFLRYALNTKSTSNGELDKMKFEKKIQEFEEKLLKNTNLPYKSKIIDLNDLRNKIYHDYRIPTNEETEEFKVITKVFLKDLIKDILDLNFDDISSFNSDYIRNPFVKDFYLTAKKEYDGGEYGLSMAHFKKTFYEQWISFYGPSINIFSNLTSNLEGLDDIVQEIDNLTLEVNNAFKILQTAIAKKNHLALKKWVNSSYHGYAHEKISIDDVTKIKIIVEEFIAETDDYILEDYLKERFEAYKSKISLEKWF